MGTEQEACLVTTSAGGSAPSPELMPRKSRLGCRSSPATDAATRAEAVEAERAGACPAHGARYWVWVVGGASFGPGRVYGARRGALAWHVGGRAVVRWGCLEAWLLARSGPGSSCSGVGLRLGYGSRVKSVAWCWRWASRVLRLDGDLTD